MTALPMHAAPSPKTAGIFIVDDSAVMRHLLAVVLGRDPAIEVIGTAADPLLALNRMNRRWPDVIVLDIEMPRMDGITFLKRLMAERPTPVVICSALSARGAATTIEALASGAVAVVPKPAGLDAAEADSEGAMELLRAIKAAAAAKMSNLRHRPARAPALPPAMPPPGRSVVAPPISRIVAIGASTGGPIALESVLSALPPEVPGILIVQHMPAGFTAPFAERLNRNCAIEVREARDGDRVMPGLALIAPGGRHLQLRRCTTHFAVQVVDGPPVNRHRPSVDVLFRSVASCVGRGALGILMTGMGDDGARGLAEMRCSGAATVAQDEATSTVYGMPREAVALNAAERVLPLGELAAAITAHVR